MPSAGRKLLPYRLSSRVAWPLQTQPYHALLQMKVPTSVEDTR